MPSRRRILLRRIVALLVLFAVVAVALRLGPLAPDDNGTNQPTASGSKRLKQLNQRTRQLQRQLDAQQAARQASHADAAGSSSASKQSFAELTKGLPGSVGLSLTAPGRSTSAQNLGELKSGSAWSTIKVALALKVTLDAGGPASLSSSQRDEISRALTASDNAAAMELWNSLVSRYGSASGAAAAVTTVLQRAGDQTQVSSKGRGSFSPYGQTEWSLAGQARFMAALSAGCVAGKQTTSYLLGEMARVVADQSWGLGSAGVPAKFKPGWGPGLDGGYLVREMGVLQTAKGPMVLAIAALPADGQFATGQQMLTTLAKWAVTNLTPPAAGGC